MYAGYARLLRYHARASTLAQWRQVRRPVGPIRTSEPGPSHGWPWIQAGPYLRAQARLLFSVYVTASRCEISAQSRTLHKWSITYPSGIGPIRRSYMTRWTRRVPRCPFSRTVICPYPLEYLARCHSRQPISSSRTHERGSSNANGPRFFTGPILPRRYQSLSSCSLISASSPCSAYQRICAA